jgi:hypothetical protein
MPPNDRSDDEERRRTREAQEAHGGSMAPDNVDPTGHAKAGTDPERQDAEEDGSGETIDPHPGIVQAT